MSLQGQLSDMSFGDLFAIITSQPRTGLLRLSNQEFRADLYVHNGQPHRAVIERITDGQPKKGLSGADAVHLMSTWQDGYFDYITLVTLPGERNIFLDKHELMLENIFKKEVFYQTPTTEPANVTSYGVHTVTGYRSKVAQLDLSVTEWTVLLQVDDQGDVGMIARQAGLKVPTTWQTLKQLEKFGLRPVFPTRSGSGKTDRQSQASDRAESAACSGPSATGFCRCWRWFVLPARPDRNDHVKAARFVDLLNPF